MKSFSTTRKHEGFWRDRKIDWKTDYFDTWTHPHRRLIVAKLQQVPFGSLLEVGCASGPNLYLIQQAFPGAQIGGVDINADAIRVAREMLPNAAVLETGPADDLFLSDKSADVVLSDMCLIYLGPKRIRKAVAEIKRVSRGRIILVEFHSRSLLKRLALWITSGYYAYDWRKMLEKQGFYDITLDKIREESWPGGEPQRSFGYIITAKL